MSRLGGGSEVVIAGEAISSRALLPEFYRRRGFRPTWSEARTVEDFLDVVRGVEADGLRPTDYHEGAIEAAIHDLDSKSPEARADLDIILSDAMVRLADHLFFGKVDPKRLDPHWNLTRTIDGEAAVAWMEGTLGKTGIRSGFERLRPPRAYYRNLIRTLATYRGIAERGGWPITGAGPPLREGASDPRIPTARRRLAVTGDLTGPSPADSLRFDASLAEAVRRFQYRAFLHADGILGATTVRAMNVPARQRVDQIRVDLERARWVMHDVPPRFVLVNVSSSLVYLVEGDTLAWRARCQVGKVARKTPIFRSDMTHLTFNPTWTVPSGILARDIFPAARRGEPILQRKRLKAIDRNGRVVSPNAVRWPARAGDPFPYTLRQDPGPENALGRVKFMFPNPYSVYLHDTPSKDLFEHDRRTFSSGCIRVENPLELAERLLADPTRWSATEIRKVVETGKTRDVSFSPRIPVLLLYWTVSIDERGVVRFSDDVYSRDAPVLQALEEPFRARRKSANTG